MMNDIALELARLHVLKGADFVRQLKMLVQSDIFKSVENERRCIFFLTLRAFVQQTLSSREKAFIRCMT